MLNAIFYRLSWLQFVYLLFHMIILTGSFALFFTLSSSSPVPDPPLIDLSNSRVYNEASICWRLSDDHLPTDHHMLEYRR